MALPLASTVSPSFTILEVGLRAIPAIISWPELIPPAMPPEEFVLNPSGVISSLLSEPLALTKSNPFPISNQHQVCQKQVHQVLLVS